MPDGNSRAWYDDGVRKHELKYSNGKKTGDNKYFYSNGNISKLESYNNDLTGLKIKTWFENGNPETVQEYLLVEEKKETKKFLKWVSIMEMQL